MAAPKAPLLDQAGKKSKDVTLEADIFGAEIKPHLVHEQVRAELNAARQGTRGAKSRGMVAGGRAKPWRQKGTGRARAGTTRAAQWTGGGVVFPPGMRNFEVKVNRKARRAAFRAALSSHANAGTLALIDGSVFDKPSTKLGVALTKAWGQKTPLLVVATDTEESLIKSFRNLPRTVVTLPSELEVSALVWANSVLVTEAALEVVQARAGNGAKEVSA
jgi:large subunit ribosomal protein L4